jgi:hypothetical protein
MRITDTGSSSKVNNTKRKKGVSAASGTGAFAEIFGAENGVDAAPEASAPANVGSVLSLDSLNMLANLNNEEFVKKQNIDWGRDILSELESIKYQILNGKISYASLSNLKERLHNIPLNSQDNKLKQIVEEIEIRAAVELEKLMKISEQTKVFSNES